MKKLFILLFLTGILKSVFAQAPQGFSYQAAVRNAAGQVKSNSNIKVCFSILDSVSNGAIVYKETHLTTTNTLGMMNLNVGMGTPIIGTLSGVNWGTNSKFLQVEIDTTTSGNNYMLIGVQQLMSVPYALYAGNSNSNSNLAQNSNFNPSLDSVLSLVGGKILETGSYTVPSKEHWKILNFIESQDFGTTNKILNRTTAYGNTIINGSCKCEYENISSTKIFQFGNFPIYGGLNVSGGYPTTRFFWISGTDPSLCPNTFQFSYDLTYNSRKLSFPIWLEPNSTLTIYENLYLSIERYK
jgi:hypothetical protein